MTVTACSFYVHRPEDFPDVTVAFLDEPTWNGRPASVDQPMVSHVLHFRGKQKQPMVDWAARWMPELSA